MFAENSLEMDKITQERRRKFVLKIREQVEAMRQSGEFESVWLSLKGFGWVAVEHSPMKRSDDEIKAAHYLADVGYQVRLKDEAGQAVTPDGFIFAFAFEQKTPHVKSSIGIYKALCHARNKSTSTLSIDVAVIFDKFGFYTKQDMEAGILEYERNHRKRFRGIIYISKTGRVTIFRHNRL